MHIESWKLELLTFILTWWPVLLGLFVATVAYSVYRWANGPKRK